MGTIVLLASSQLASCVPKIVGAVVEPDASGLETSILSALAITPADKTLAVGNTFIFSGEGGEPPYIFSKSSGVGTVNASTGAYTADGGVGLAIVRVTDAQGQEADAQVVINGALAISPTEITLAAGGSQVFSASGGVSDYAYSVVSGGGSFIGATYTAPAIHAGAAVTVQVVDEFGNVSQASVTVPAITVSISAPLAGAVINAAGQASVALSGSCSENARTVSVSVTGGGSASPSCLDGSWSANLNLTSASDGSIVLAVNHSNLNDVAAAEAQVSVVKDAAVPTAIAITTPADGAYVNGANKAAFTIAGSCSETGTDNVNVKAGATSVGTVDCSGGSFTGTFDLTSISDGALSLTAVLSDAAGNSRTASAIGVTKDIVMNASSSVDDGTWWASTTNSPSIAWSTVADADLNRYEVALGTAPGGTNVVTWSSSGTLTLKQFDGLSLSHGQTYYASVRAVDNLGNISSVTEGNGFVVDEVGPSAPTGISLGSVPGNLTSTPTISYTAAVDALSGTASHEVKIIKTAGSVLVRDWATHASGEAVIGMSPALEGSTEYTVLVRGVDAAGNDGTASSAVNWTSAESGSCASGTAPIGTVCPGGALYAGQFDGGKYMVTPSGCTDSATPTCAGGVDTVSKRWRGSTGTSVDIPGITNITEASTPSSSSERGDYATAAMVAHASISSNSAAHYCSNMVYGGYSDWYLPSKSELAYLYCHLSTSEHDPNYPEEDPDCTAYGGKTSELTGFQTGGYVSSTEFDANWAWTQVSHSGSQTMMDKSASIIGIIYVRCMRRDPI